MEGYYKSSKFVHLATGHSLWTHFSRLACYLFTSIRFREFIQILKDTNNEERYALLELQHQLLLVGMGDRTATKGVDQNIPHPSPQMKIFIHTNHALTNITMNIQQKNIYDKKIIIIIIIKIKKTYAVNAIPKFRL